MKLRRAVGIAVLLAVTLGAGVASALPIARWGWRYTGMTMCVQDGTGGKVVELWEDETGFPILVPTNASCTP